MADIDQEFVEYVVKSIVDHPDKVDIKRSVDERGVLLELAVDPEDMGKIIGKSGATAKSIRTLLRVLGAKNDARFNLKIVEPEGGMPRPHAEHHNDVPAEPAAEEASSKPAEPMAAPEEPMAVENEASAEEQATSNADDIKARAREGLEDLDLDV